MTTESDNIKKMLQKAQMVMMNAYAPYSHFLVGACILADDNNYYVGCNVENIAYRLTTCAECAAICNMISYGGKHITEMVITTSKDMIISPCGACRQQIIEFAAPDRKIHLFSAHGKKETIFVKDLLPLAFNSF
jgi:cytidine deaminase